HPPPAAPRPHSPRSVQVLLRSGHRKRPPHPWSPHSPKWAKRRQEPEQRARLAPTHSTTSKSPSRKANFLALSPPRRRSSIRKRILSGSVDRMRNTAFSSPNSVIPPAIAKAVATPSPDVRKNFPGSVTSPMIVTPMLRVTTTNETFGASRIVESLRVNSATAAETELFPTDTAPTFGSEIVPSTPIVCMPDRSEEHTSELQSR